MSNYTAEEIEAALAVEPEEEDSFSFDEEGGWGEFAYQNDGHEETLVLRGESVKMTLVASDTGGEGHGEDVWVVARIGDQLFKKSGYYASHYGTDWDGDLRQVQVVDKIVTFYE